MCGGGRDLKVLDYLIWCDIKHAITFNLILFSSTWLEIKVHKKEKKTKHKKILKKHVTNNSRNRRKKKSIEKKSCLSGSLLKIL